MPIQNEKQRLTVTADDLISVTVDASDLSVASAEPLKSIINRYGRPANARAFADYQQAPLAELSVQLYQMGFTLVHCPTWPNGEGFPKSVVADVMAQDLRDQVEDVEGVETYLVVATSRDYIAVTNALKRHDKRVVIVAEEAKVCRELRMCADEFVALPPVRVESIRSSRSASGRFERTAERAEVARAERAPVEVSRVERLVEKPAEVARVERVAEVVRVERPPEVARAERAVEPAKLERAPEPPRVERVERVEVAEPAKLPGDVEVIAEVKRIVAAEGICTPRRLARALCPVDRTPTGELRSRIANRIQSLVDSGKLQRERLVVGGTSVETILAKDERSGRPVVAPQLETPVAAPPVDATPSIPAVSGPQIPGLYELVVTPPAIVEPLASEPVVESPVVEEALIELLSVESPKEEPAVVEAVSTSEAKVEGETQAIVVIPEPEPVKSARSPMEDLDAFVESVLRGPEVGAMLLNKEPSANAEAPAPDPAEETPTPAETPKPRRRRRTPTRAAVPETNGSV